MFVSTQSAQTFSRYKEVLNLLDRAHMDLLDDLYEETMQFQDPVRAISGRAAFRGYLERLYANVAFCRFQILHEAIQGDTGFLTWKMEMRHERFRPKETLFLDGMSMIVIGSQGRIQFHQDSFDLGAMLYERLPILGGLTRRIKESL